MGGVCWRWCRWVGSAGGGARPLMNRSAIQNYWFTYNEPMSVESVTQSVSNLALRFSEDDEEEEEDGMVGWEQLAGEW